VPDGVGGVSDDGRASLLAMVAEGGEHASLPGVDGHLQVGVGVEEHALLQAHRVEVFTGGQNARSASYHGLTHHEVEIF